MTDESKEQSKYVDGVIDLHHKLRTVYGEALKAAKKLGINMCNSAYVESFNIFIDFAENQSSKIIKGYFMHYGKIYRFLPVVFDSALLFPVRNHGGGEFRCGKGITYKILDDARKNCKRISLNFRKVTDVQKVTLYNINIRPLTYGCDELGLPYVDFSDIEELALIDFPMTLFNRSFTLVGQEHCAPNTNNDLELHCFLYAQLGNRHDEKTIKVFRWLPQTRLDDDSIISNDIEKGDVFFELGYISREEGDELHSYMLKNKSRLLLGKIKQKSVSIIGSVKEFQTNGFKYPKCLYNLKLK